MRISPFEANHGSDFVRPNIIRSGSGSCSAISRLAYLINTDWIYSSHWPESNHNALLKKIQDDIDTELNKATARIAQLEEAKSILGRIDIEEYGEPGTGE